MLTASDITEPGFYWLFDPIGAPPTIVEVAGEARAELVVRFPGRQDEDALQDLAGGFVGPLQPHTFTRFDFDAVNRWAANPHRKPAVHAFTSGLERQVAMLIERAGGPPARRPARRRDPGQGRPGGGRDHGEDRHIPLR